ncbi:MAG: ABC transporter ATP-binding protein [Solirubrobacterales bacterium]
MAVDATRSAPAGPAAASEAPLAIEVRDLEKAFRLPGQKVDSLKERVLHPLADRGYTTFTVLDGISFDVRHGEFFGIVGRNGSGKSTLLKILASIYRPDAGRVRMAGTLAPFIELGVGFNMELTARENVQLNGVMMGLSRRDAASRLDAVLEFAELEEFVDLKLKNYSSGMLVRLAFSAMIQADTDILLVDEVLAVGDASFQQKCADVFRQMRSSGKTVVLVTHDMAAVQAYCHRAILLDHGQILVDGDPSEVGRRYLRINFEERAAHAAKNNPIPADDAKLVELWLEDAVGERVSAVEPGEEIHLRAVVEANADVCQPFFGFLVTDAGGADIFTCGTGLGDGAQVLERGRRARIRTELRNELTPGRYTVHFSATHGDSGAAAVWQPFVFDFAVSGPPSPGGIVVPDHRSSASLEPEGSG